MKRINNEGLLISLKLGTIFISHLVLFYVLNDLYLFRTFPGRQAWEFNYKLNAGYTER